MYIYIFMYTYIHIFIYISGYVYRQIDTYYIYIYKHTYMHTQNIPLVPFFFVSQTWFWILLRRTFRHPVIPSEATPFAHVGRRRKTNRSPGKLLRVSQALRNWINNWGNWRKSLNHPMVRSLNQLSPAEKPRLFPSGIVIKHVGYCNIAALRSFVDEPYQLKK